VSFIHAENKDSLLTATSEEAGVHGNLWGVDDDPRDVFEWEMEFLWLQPVAEFDAERAALRVEIRRSA
jgi:hypothetical protein